MIGGLDRGRRRIFIFLAAIGFSILFLNVTLLTGTDVKSKIEKIPIHIPGVQQKPEAPPEPELPKSESWYQDHDGFENHADVDDHHPIAGFMKNADEKVKAYEEGISRTFKETVNKYRRKYGRHPPPGFRDWYKFAREKGVYNIDDFEQVMDDIRPFWGVEPSLIRKYASTLALNEGAGLSGCYIRDKKIWKTTHVNWRMENFQKLVEKFVKYLPDMDIVMNRHDQPRVTVPWDDLQALLKKEEQGRRVAPEVLASWSTNMTGFYVENANLSIVDIPDPKWTDHPRQQYMNLAKEACPPDSPARNPNHNKEEVEASYKDPISGLITNFNKTSDLCVIGPEIQDKHGFLFSAATLVNSKQLLPIFGECKVNVNNDILFPANMYYNHDTRYFYNAENDYNWDDKHDTMLWRGVTSGGTGDADNWRKMHRQRLQLATNGTELVDKRVRLLKQEPEKPGYYTTMENFNAGLFMKQNTDVAFTAGVDCIPARSKDEGGGCPFYDNVWTFAPEILLAAQFRNKYLIDVDGASFSGRWRAFLQSKSLGLKATIFREWHDSRLFAWKHFVPVDHRYDDIYSILTYFIGLGKATEASYSGEPYVQRHDFEGRKIASQGREWASKVLRDEDIEIYMFRLLIEYGRVIDDNRDRIGYSGDGTELDKYDAALDVPGKKESPFGAKDANGAHG